MAKLQFSGAKIRAIAACVPAKISRNETALKGIVPDAEIEKTIAAIGIREKRIAPPDVCASDLCACAAEKLFADNSDIARDSIDVLIFMSQTADYRIPATAPILQKRLGLSENCACFDLSLACSGFVYALSTAFAYATNNRVRRVLLLDGETFSKIVNPRDRVNAPLYGDAGTATLIEKADAPDAFFVLGTDGSGENAVKIPAGGMRVPATQNSFEEKTDADGSLRSAMQLFMDGMDVFNFALRRVPATLKEVADFSKTPLASADAVVFHQANKMMTDFLAKRLNILAEKVPYSLEKFGNTSSASIPLTIAETLRERTRLENVFLCGFGAGLSWGAAKISFAETKISPVVTYRNLAQ